MGGRVKGGQGKDEESGKDLHGMGRGRQSVLEAEEPACAEAWILEEA